MPTALGEEGVRLSLWAPHSGLRTGVRLCQLDSQKLGVLSVLPRSAFCTLFFPELGVHAIAVTSGPPPGSMVDVRSRTGRPL